MLVRQPAPSDTQREQRSSSEGRLWLTLKFLVGKCWHSSLKCQSRCQLSFTIPSRYSTTDSPFHKRVQPCASRILTWIAFGVFCSAPARGKSRRELRNSWRVLRSKSGFFRPWRTPCRAINYAFSTPTRERSRWSRHLMRVTTSTRLARPSHVAA